MIFGAYYRSLLIYYLTPIKAAGTIAKLEIDNLEAKLKRKLNLLPGGIKSAVINSVLGHFDT